MESEEKEEDQATTPSVQDKGKGKITEEEASSQHLNAYDKEAALKAAFEKSRKEAKLKIYR